MEGQTSSPEIQIYSLGPLGVKRGGEMVKGFESDKARALLAYLAMEREFPHPRDALTEMFWPDLSPAAGRHNLSQVIFSLKEALEVGGSSRPLFLTDRNSIELNPAAPTWVDALAFEELLDACLVHPHEQAEACAHCMDLRRQAVDLYREDFLRGLTIDGSAAFDDWLIQKRERLHRMAIEALEDLADYHERRGEYGPAQAYSRRQIALERWREEAHRQVMRCLAHNGQRSAALAQYEICSQILDQELGVSPEKETRDLYDQIRNADRQRRHNLPAQLTPFVGREAEVASILLSLANPDCRVLTILGPGGVGKTSVVLQVAGMAVDRFLDGVWFVPLLGVASVELLLPAIASALETHFSEIMSLDSQLFDYLSHREILLVLDNFEHLQAGAGFISEITRRAPGVKILVTSRARLNLTQAWAVHLDGLDVPASVDMDAFWSSSAIQLFQYGARRAVPEFHLREEEKTAARKICLLVEGLPLAIELAASWTRVLTCTEIVQEIERSLGFLEYDAMDLAPRHRNMRAVIQYSWQLLTSEEQRAFRRLGIFPGSFTRQAAAQIAGTGLSTLAGLVDKSLVRKIDRGRFELHELLRQYASETLSQDEPEFTEVQHRFAEYYAALVAERTPLLIAGGREGAIQDFELELGNAQAAWYQAVLRRDQNTLVRLSDGLFWYFEWRSRYKEGLELFREAIRHLDPDREAHEIWLASLMVRCACFHTHLAEVPQAKELFQASAEVLRNGADRLELALLLDFWGDWERETGDYRLAKTRLEESAAVFRDLERNAELAMALNHLGTVVHRLGEYEQARAYLAESLTLFRKAKNLYGIAIAVHNLGHVSFDLGDYAGANGLFQESLAARQQLGDQWGVAIVHNNLGNVQYELEDYGQAEKFYQQSLDQSRQLGDRRGIAVVQNNLGLIAVERGDFRKAEEFYQASREVCQEIGNHQGVSIALNNLGEVASLQGANERAYEYHRESLSISRAINYARGIMYALEYLGQAAIKLSRLEEAKGYFQDALRLAWDAQAMPRVMQAVFGLALVLRQTDTPAQAVWLLQIVAAHPASERTSRENAKKLIAEENEQLTPGSALSREILEKAVNTLLAEENRRDEIT